jgi:zinc transporter ZupT
MHEVPQELGDFAILVSAGFSKKQALIWNFVSACTCILGTIIGLGLGEINEDVNAYILALIAGGFLYISLADMVHELTHSKGFDQTLIQCGSMLFGFFIMMVIAIWFEDLSVCL